MRTKYRNPGMMIEWLLRSLEVLKRKMSEEKMSEEEIYEDHWNTGELCPFCGALKGEPHGEHKFV